MQAAAFAGLNGAGLALVLPCVQSILAEVYSADKRGLAFGLVMTAGILGECLRALRHKSYVLVGVIRPESVLCDTQPLRLALV